MALTQRLEFRQSQALVMTPQLMQAIKLLQLSNLDLAAYVEGELERNPLLERSSEGPDTPQQGEAPAAGQEASEAPADWNKSDVNGSAAIEDSFDTPIENVFPDSEAPPRPAQAEPAAYSEWAGVGSGGREDGDYNLEAFVSAETTLADYLAEQLSLAIADPVRRMIGQHLIDSVDDAGYLVGDPAAIAEKLGAPLGEIEAVLAILQGFDPPGVCARNLSECLTIQLKELDRFDPAMAALIAHLDLVARRDFSALRRLTWLIRALDQRAKTILKVSTEIVRQQDAFLAHGVQFLRPLNLKTVADAIGMHESTVSRVTANKYMATSRGIFELKYFFTSAIAAADGGEAHSAEAVRHRIKQLIDAESADDVLSDDTIVDRLREAGIDIARRTVAKYREAMRIPSSVQRRREKQALSAAS
jgi:DNA-directed RNA polymerase specialized sigma54-like protein